MGIRVGHILATILREEASCADGMVIVPPTQRDSWHTLLVSAMKPWSQFGHSSLKLRIPRGQIPPAIPQHCANVGRHYP